jgi:hypothetical protein
VRRRLGIACDVASGGAGYHTARWTSRTSVSVTVYRVLVAIVYEWQISFTCGDAGVARTSSAWASVLETRRERGIGVPRVYTSCHPDFS